MHTVVGAVRAELQAMDNILDKKNDKKHLTPGTIFLD